MSTFLFSLKKRLPGGSILFDLTHSAVDFRYGLRITFLRFLFHLSIFFCGCRRIRHNSVIGELKPPYPTLYHFTRARNSESIREKGLLPNQGAVWMTDWTEPRWVKSFGFDRIACFRIDTEALIASGLKVEIRERCHEFTTDHGPPRFLTEIQYNTGKESFI